MIMNCRKCKKTFKNIREYFKHRYQQCRPKTCPTCSQTFSSAVSLFNHINHQQKVNCVHCNRRFCTNNELQRHLRSLRSISDDSIPDLNQRIYPETGYEDEENYQETINQKINVIRDRVEKHSHYQTINKQIDPSFTYREINEFLIDFYSNHINGFKINLGLGFILYHTTTERYKYNYVSTNNLLFEKAVPITTRKDVADLIKHIISLDLPTNYYLKKPSSGWILAGLTNITYIITEMKKTLIGGPVELPRYIKNSRCIRGLTHNNKNGKKYKDNKCFFRCLALHQGVDIKVLERPATKLKEELEKHTGMNFDDGVALNQIPTIEVKFRTSINILSLKEDGCADVVYLSRLNYRPMYVNLYKDHFSHISNYQRYAKRFQCLQCNRTFDRTDNLSRHTKICNTEVEEVYIGGKFKTNDTIFERMEKVGINVPESDRYYKFISTFDYEAIQAPSEETVQGREMHYVHIPASFSVCSNIPGHTVPRHEASDGSPQKLVDTMVQLQLEQQETASLYMREKFEWVFDELQEELITLEKLKSEEGKKKCKKYQTLYHQLEDYCDKLPIVGFNSQRYDLPLIKRYLPSALQRLDALPSSVIRKEKSYMLLATKRLKYLDLTNYLAAGTSLSAFYKAYNVTDPKGIFPYEWFDSLEKLDYAGLPPKEAFHSLLTKETISDDDYESCWRVWDRENMYTFRDYVKHYNNLDVTGLVEGIEKMIEIKILDKLDMFKTSVSLPGLTQQYLFRNLGEDYFTIFGPEHKHIYKEMKQGVVGGPSLVFCRYQEAGKTLIKGKEICQRVIGYDASSLYLNCTGKAMPTGRYELREKKDDFKKLIKYSKESLQWLEYIMRRDGIHIRHAENCVHGEKRIENFSVDGYCSENNTVYEYIGCYHHGHSCKYNDPKKWGETVERLNKIQGLGYNVVAITSCEWAKYEVDVEIPSTPPVCTVKDIEDAIMSGESFGFVKCDIHVPEHLIDHFSEFPVIFKNTEITIADIGEHMQEYARSIQREKGVDKALISSMKGDGIILLTPLFQKYIEMGLVCTDIEWILEYHPKEVFEWFQDKVVDDRRMADLDPAYAIRGETSKTAGNCGYGKCNIDKTKHNTVSFAAEENLDIHIQNPLFKTIEELEDGIHEVVKAKKKVVIDTPIQVSSAVYSYAKLSLINFWEFINKYLIYDYYQLMETDTDSLYIALARETLDECVKPELKAEWDQVKWKFLSSEDNETMVDFNGYSITLRQYDKRTPGKYKEEFNGIGMVCLNAKVYHIWSDRYDEYGNAETKTSCKGMQKKRNKLVRDDFLEMLENPRHQHFVENAGFIIDGLDTKTYTQTKKGLNYFYCKRKVLADGVSTVHLDI